MPLDIPAFNDAFGRARDRVRGGQAADIPAEQEKLRALVPTDASEHDQTWTARLIARLAEPPAPPRQWSELFYEADRIHAAAYPPRGSTEEKIAMLADARRRIWEIADRASEDEADDIRAMTEDLQSMEGWIRNPQFPLTDTPFPTSDA
ncbi:hypothetical protein [Kribbella jiaozuonensis]|uniref:Uncharacterized protein n=1 Tax=Kribbella jiaozuonensis TaxID=2575441 RepID=A0A4U3LDA7_9ACTN|nr:hypothetical protein [Kribbella jiaozuonensis]TKK73300.1 hypothetical protein FDA38_38960 [Kribbella jiaozuonensis]